MSILKLSIQVKNSIMLEHFVYEYKCRAKDKEDVVRLKNSLLDQIEIKSSSKDMLFSGCIVTFRSNLKQKDITLALKQIDPSHTMFESLEQIVQFRQKRI
jgi:hypothetical protein